MQQPQTNATNQLAASPTCNHAKGCPSILGRCSDTTVALWKAAENVVAEVESCPVIEFGAFVSYKAKKSNQWHEIISSILQQSQVSIGLKL